MNFSLSFVIDFGYDISDYESIQPEYGTMADFDELIAEAKKLGEDSANTQKFTLYLKELSISQISFHYVL